VTESFDYKLVALALLQFRLKMDKNIQKCPKPGTPLSRFF